MFRSILIRNRSLLLTFVILLCCSLSAVMPFANFSRVAHSQEPQAGPLQPDAFQTLPPGFAYRQTNFISDSPGVAMLQDLKLVNPWGIASTGASPFWIANNNGGSTATLYRGDVSGSPLVKNSTPPPGTGLDGITINGGKPTGVVNNGTSDFLITPCGIAQCPATFIFASATGDITAWNPNSPAAGSTQAKVVAAQQGHNLTGLAIGSSSGGPRLFAPDFANGNIDVYDGTFALTTVSGGFVDATIPTAGTNVYHPYNVQNIGGQLYVTYAKMGTDGKPVAGAGNGFVRRFNTNGVRDSTFGIDHGQLNAPWGVALAPLSFGILGGALLVGNFGEGGSSINAYDPTTGLFKGSLRNEAGQGIEIDGLRALKFGNDGNGGDSNTLYFSAGIGEEGHGLFGSLRPTTQTAASLVQFSSDTYTVGEATSHLDVAVTRTGNASGTTTVNYATFDINLTSHADQKSDYIISAGTLTFGPGETSKTFRVLLEDDLLVEGNQVINLYLSNPTGAGLGSPNTATITIVDNDSVSATTQPLEIAQYFVRQQYLDFLGREPDPGGLTYWTSQITNCGADASCIRNQRVGVSAAFFIENEFQQTGFFVYRTYKVAFGVKPLYGDYLIGHSLIGFGSDAEKTTYLTGFQRRPDFQAKYPDTMTTAQYVDSLLANTTIVDTPFRDSLVFGMDHGTENRTSVLQKIAEHPTLKTVEFNQAFVAAQYFGYLRRDPDTNGYNFWLNILDGSNPPQFRGMVCSFITSEEYQDRASFVLPRNNSECASITP